MTSNNDSRSSDTNNNKINDSSYHLKTISFEDSQIDHFIPYSSPSILYWQTNNKRYSNTKYSEYTQNGSNISDIEKRRGNLSNQDLTSNLIQIPAEDTIDFTNKLNQFKSNKTNLNDIKSAERLDQIKSDSKLIPSILKSDLKSMDLSSLKDISNLNELNKSKTLTDLENNIQKRLEYLNITDQYKLNDQNENDDEYLNDLEKSNVQKKIEIQVPSIKLNSMSYDDTAEVLLELSGELEDNLELINKKFDIEEVKKLDQAAKTEELIIKDFDETEFLDPEIDYFKIIDDKLSQMRKKRIEQIHSDKQVKNLENVKKTFSAISWDISANNSDKSQTDENCTEKKLKNFKKSTSTYQEVISSSFKENQLNELKNLFQNPVKTLIENTSRSNKENYSNNEVSTQTSFIQTTSTVTKQNRRPTNDETYKKSPLNQLKFDSVQQKKIKQMIKAQKHEKRYKELELLAKLERLQAERLKKLITENDSCDSSSFFYDSYFQATTSSHLDYENSLNIDRIEKVIDEYKNRRKSEFHPPKLKNFDDLSLISEVDSVLGTKSSTKDNFSNLKKSQVEVVNLKNTTIHQQPKGVYVVKENQIKNGSIKTEKQELKKNLNENTRTFFTDITSRTNIKNSTDKIQQPESVIKNNERTRTLSNNKQNEKFIISKDDNSQTGSFNKMSLQEAFSIFRRDLIIRSNNRVKEIEERSKMRQEQAEFDRKRAQMNMKLKEAQKRLNKQSSQNQDLIIRRKLSCQEIKNITKKNYEKLPEVKQKQVKERMEQTKRLNLIKSSIYKKTIQQHVLSKGPNFGLNYKALEN